MSGRDYAVENLDALKTTEAERLLSNAVEVRRRLYANAESAEEVGDFRAASQSYAFILRSLELIGKLLSQFKGYQSTTINQLTISPDYLRMRAALIQALAPYPEARRAVSKVLCDLESAEVADLNDLPKEQRALKMAQRLPAVTPIGRAWDEGNGAGS